MKAYRRFMGILVLFAILIVGPAGDVLGQNQNAPDDRGHFRMGLWTSLTQEQRQALWSMVAEMRDQGASPEEVHSAVAQMLKGYGIELPEHWGKGFPRGPRRFLSQLTTEQRQALREKVKEMGDQGASPEEIHKTVTEMLKGYGIEVPEKWGRGFPNGPRRFLFQLTPEQRKAVQEKVKGMHSQGASPEETRKAVTEMLRGYGIELPENEPKISPPMASPEPRIIVQSHPNPLNPETQIRYTLTAPGEVRVKIYNVTGEVVRTFNEGYHLAGSYSLQWDGCDANGNRASSGIYLYRIEAGPYSATGRMILLR